MSEELEILNTIPLSTGGGGGSQGPKQEIKEGKYKGFLTSFKPSEKAKWDNINKKFTDEKVPAIELLYSVNVGGELVELSEKHAAKITFGEMPSGLVKRMGEFTFAGVFKDSEQNEKAFKEFMAKQVGRELVMKLVHGKVAKNGNHWIKIHSVAPVDDEIPFA